MNPKIKQKIEKESFIIYPIDLKGTGLDWNKALRDEWVKGAEYGYNIKESVNEKLELSIRTKLQYLESLAEFTVSTDTVRAWIDFIYDSRDDF